jgi:hypothetical protein
VFGLIPKSCAELDSVPVRKHAMKALKSQLINGIFSRFHLNKGGKGVVLCKNNMPSCIFLKKGGSRGLFIVLFGKNFFFCKLFFVVKIFLVMAMLLYAILNILKFFGLKFSMTN